MLGMYDEGGLGLLADRSRRAIFYLLARRPASVGELAQKLPISRPAISQHLKILKDGGLISDHAEGTRRIYRVNPDGIDQIRLYVTRVWLEALFTDLRFPPPVSAPEDHIDTGQSLVVEEIPNTHEESRQPDVESDHTATETGAGTIAGVQPRVIG